MDYFLDNAIALFRPGRLYPQMHYFIFVLGVTLASDYTETRRKQ